MSICATSPENRGIERLSSTWLNNVSTVVAVRAITIDMTILFRIRYAMMMFTMNWAITPSHALSFNPWIQCLPKLIPNIAAAISPNIVINNAVIAILISKTENAIIAPKTK